MTIKNIGPKFYPAEKNVVFFGGGCDDTRF